MQTAPVPENQNAVRTARKRFSRIGFALLAFLGVTYLAFYALFFSIANIRPSLLLSLDFQFLLSEGCMYIFGLGACLLVLIGMPHSAPFRTKIGGLSLFRAFFICIFLTYVGNYVGLFVGSAFESLSGIGLENTAMDLIGQLPIWLVLLFVVVIGPLVEEFLFRKVIIDRTRVYGEKLAILFSALLFGFFHTNLYQFFYATALGLVFGYVYMRSGKLWQTWLLHALVNFFGSALPILLMRYTNFLQLEMTDSSSFASVADAEAFFFENMTTILWTAMFVWTMFALFIAGFIFFLLRVRHLHFYPAEEDLPRDSEGSVAFVNVGTILFILVCVALPLVKYWMM